jgi:hypothetical protein
MHLLLAASQDATGDLIVEGLGDNVVRLNNDRWGDHEIQINNQGFLIRDRFGREVTHRNLRTLILRKFVRRPPHASDEEVYAYREHTRAIESLLDWVTWKYPEKVPINPFRMNQVTKFNMADIAEKYFHVPKWAFSNTPSKSGLNNAVLKNLCGMPFKSAENPTDPSAFVYVQEVDLQELADGWPWYLQEKVDAKLDLTVAYIGGKCFGLQLNRGKFSGIDWRKHIGTSTDNDWESAAIPAWLETKIHAYMSELRLDYGRLDFLASDSTFRDLSFLEVNPHGQWGWMDLNKSKGIYEAMMKFLTTPRPFRQADNH